MVISMPRLEERLSRLRIEGDAWSVDRIEDRPPTFHHAQVITEEQQSGWNLETTQLCKIDQKSPRVFGERPSVLQHIVEEVVRRTVM